MKFREGKNVLVTGGSGLIGSHLVELLIDKGAHVRVVLRSKDSAKNLSKCLNKIEVIRGDLTRWNSCRRVVRNIDTIFHLAAVVRGINYSISHPASVYTPNVLMNTQMLEAARLEDVEKYLFTSSARVYPPKCKIPIREDEAWAAFPESINDTYGVAKLMGELQAQAYVKEYGMKIAIVRPFNAYGPRDNFDLKTAQVIPTIIRKAVEMQDPFVIWSGEPSNDFIYVTDVARGMLLAVEKYAVADPVNIGTGKEVKIKVLVDIILKLSGHRASKIKFKAGKLLEPSRSVADTTKAEKTIGFKTEIALKEGLKRTLEWYRTQKLGNAT